MQKIIQVFKAWLRKCEKLLNQDIFFLVKDKSESEKQQGYSQEIEQPPPHQSIVRAENGRIDVFKRTEISDYLQLWCDFGCRIDEKSSNNDADRDVGGRTASFNPER